MPNYFRDASVRILLMNAIFAACFYVTFSSLPLTMLDETTDLKTAFTTIFEELPHHLQHCLQNGSRLGVVREEEDTALTSPLHGPGAGLLLEQGGSQQLGSSSQDKDHGTEGPAETISWWSGRGISSHSANSRALQLRNFPQKMGITSSCTRLGQCCAGPQAQKRWMLCQAAESESKTWSYVIILPVKRDCHLWEAFAENVNCTQHTHTHAWKSFKQYSKHSQDFQLLSQLTR